MTISIDLEFTTIEIHDGYIVAKTREGEEVTLEKHLQLLDHIGQHLTSPYGIIFDEVNSSSFDFSVLTHMRDDPNIICIGFVYYRHATKVSLSVAKRIINKACCFSTSFDVIEHWVVEQINQLH